MNKRKKIVLCFFIDALGWNVLERNRDFLRDIFTFRKPLETILGYSSACDPSIISGLFPNQHKHWSSYYYTQHPVCYRWLRYLSFLPRWISDKSRFRNYLSLFVKSFHGFTGYFQLYHLSFEKYPFFEYAEKKRMWKPGGLINGKNIFDFLTQEKYPYYVGDQDQEIIQFQKVQEAIQKRSICFSYVLLGQLDALMHAEGPYTKKAYDLLDQYDKRIYDVIATARMHYDEVVALCFSDHGMHEVELGFDLQKEVEALPLQWDKDYIAFYDSTMGRFWLKTEKARTQITRLLSNRKEGVIVENEELKQLGVYFPHHQYGELIFLLHAPYLLCPSDMGKKIVKGMHGYHPRDADSKAAILSTVPIPDGLKGIEQIFWMMMQECGMRQNIAEASLWRTPL